ncbi:MAG: ArdC-like ssDNA-binding domain-containing protein [Oscillospiraceae bacterium]|nr:ArdC-like ssDNA-binding domain-containing protein [Oscillospiraceae bacterium]
MIPADYPTPEERLREVMEKLEDGVGAVFQSGRYAAYLQTMSKFHRYSFNNVLLIALQYPAASRVAGFHAWQKDFGRKVKKGETGIRILAPCPYKKLLEQDKIDPQTRQPVLDAGGNPVKEAVSVSRASFKVVTVFDVSQTEGKELPALGVSELTGSVEQYTSLTAALRELSPVPVAEKEMPGQAKGCYDHLAQTVFVKSGMSELQTVKTLIHEIAHAKLHALPVENGAVTGLPEKDRRTREVEAESVAYVVCQHFGIDTADYSFGYVAGWSKGRELPELKASLDCIRATAAELIDGLERQCPELAPPVMQSQTKTERIPQR